MLCAVETKLWAIASDRNISRTKLSSLASFVTKLPRNVWE
jgi:hypothetical protein